MPRLNEYDLAGALLGKQSVEIGRYVHAIRPLIPEREIGCMHPDCEQPARVMIGSLYVPQDGPAEGKTVFTSNLFCERMPVRNGSEMSLSSLGL